MTKIARLGESESEKFRLSLISIVAVCATVFVTPFAVFRLYIGDYLVGITDTALVLVTIACALCALKTHSTRIAGIVLTSVLLLATVVVAREIGIDGAIWIFPVMMFGFYLVAHWLAGVMFLVALAAIALLDVTAEGGIFSSTSQMAGYFAASAAGLVFTTLFARQYSVQSQRLMKWAILDTLTGLGNRRSLEHELQVAVATDRRQGLSQALMIVDLDNFKQLNDRLGHFTADRILQDFAALLRTSTRLEDRIFRYGGDEFVVILPNTDVEGLEAAIEHLVNEIHTHFRDRHYPVTASIGGGILEPEETLEQWRERVDRCMYEAKEHGGDVWVIADRSPAA